MFFNGRYTKEVAFLPKVVYKRVRDYRPLGKASAKTTLLSILPWEMSVFSGVFP